MTKVNFEGLLSSNFETLQDCLVSLAQDFTKDKQQTSKIFLSLSNCDDLIWSLTNLFSLDDHKRTASNAAFIIGNLAETEKGCTKIFDLIKGNVNSKMLESLASMLSSHDEDTVMNATGSLATLAESASFRARMTEQDLFFDILLSNIAELLMCENIWTSSNAALLLARLAISDEGCTKLLEHKFSRQILNHLIISLGDDEAGRGMNCAFTVGRLLSIKSGKEKLLRSPKVKQMVESLALMLNDGWMGCMKNACFAISCLASINEGCEMVLASEHFDRNLQRLIQLLQSNDDAEARWFAAMTLRTLSSHPHGLVRLRCFNHLITTLQNIQGKKHVANELNDEVEKTLDLLQNLDQPAPPVIEEVGSDYIETKWRKLEMADDVKVIYQLYVDSNLYYEGEKHDCKVEDLTPNTSYKIKLKICLMEKQSSFSRERTISTVEGVPSVPRDVRILVTFPTKIRLAWFPPSKSNGNLIGYSIFVDKKLVDTTTETNYVINRLHPSHRYLIEISAFTYTGNGDKIQVFAATTELSYHAPSKPTVSVIGRNEMMVSWNPPHYPIGRFFRYELAANSKVIYSGHEKVFHVTNLTPDTDYIFMVSAITSEGRCESDSTRKRTHKNTAPSEKGRIKSKTFSFLAKESTPQQSVDLLQRQQSERLRAHNSSARRKKKSRSKSTSAINYPEEKAHGEKSETAVKMKNENKFHLSHRTKCPIRRVGRQTADALSFSPEEIILPVAGDSSIFGDSNYSRSVSSKTSSSRATNKLPVKVEKTQSTDTSFHQPPFHPSKVTTNNEQKEKKTNSREESRMANCDHEDDLISVRENSNEMELKQYEMLKPSSLEYLSNTCSRSPFHHNLRLASSPVHIRKSQWKSRLKNTTTQECHGGGGSWLSDMNQQKLTNYKFIPSQMRRLQQTQSPQQRNEEATNSSRFNQKKNNNNRNTLPSSTTFHHHNSTTPSPTNISIRNAILRNNTETSAALVRLHDTI